VRRFSGEIEMTGENVSQEEALARRCVEMLYEHDNASRNLGMKITSVSPGRVKMTMIVRQDMVNGHDLCHGGLIFTLADTTFAFAANSHNESVLPMNCAIDYVRPALKGDELTAVAVERSKGRTTGVYDVTVTNQEEKVIAHFRARSSGRGEPLIRGERLYHA
jgi:acyl-CoA thioesterase